MTVDPLTQAFEERLQEIDAYLGLLESLEFQAQTGPPVLGGKVITAQQQKILYSSVYLQLYNLVEATVTWCISAVASAASSSGHWRPIHLTDELRKEWIRTTARTHIELNTDNRLKTAIDFCNYILKGHALASWEVEVGGGGNWDDYELEEISKRIGCELRISRPVHDAAKRIIRDDKNSLRLVKYLRNKLAHGAISFEDCGNGVTVADLLDIKDRTADYLREVVVAFNRFLYSYEFISAEYRPYIGGEI